MEKNNIKPICGREGCKDRIFSNHIFCRKHQAEMETDFSREIGEIGENSYWEICSDGVRTLRTKRKPLTFY